MLSTSDWHVLYGIILNYYKHLFQLILNTLNCCPKFFNQIKIIMVKLKLIMYTPF